MPEPKKTKDDGGSSKRLTPEEMAQLAKRPMSGLIPAMIEQDRLNGVDENHLPFLKPDKDEERPDDDPRDTDLLHEVVQQPAHVTEGHSNASSTYNQQIFDAVKNGAGGMLEELLSRYVGSPDCKDDKGRTPVMVAAEAGDAALVGVCIEHNADVNAIDAEGETALMKAIYGGHLDVVKLLFSEEAALDMRNNEGLSALEIAQEMEHKAVVAFLTAHSPGSTSSIEAETSTDPDDDTTANGPTEAAAVPSMVPSSRNQECEEEQVSDAISDVAKSSDLEPQYQEETALEPISDSDSQAPSHGSVLEKKAETSPALRHSVIPENEKRIEFDALDNKQVRSINEKVIKVFDKAGREVGDYVVDTVFKGSHLAVLKRRSQENKRWGKLKRHPEWVIDPRKLTEITGACAARRYCLAEGVDISPFSLSHFIELYYVKDLKLLLTLAEKASTNNYTVRQLKQAVEDLREHKDDHDPGKVIIKTLDQPVPLLDDPDLAELCKDKDRVLEELSKAERKKIRSLIKERKPGLDEWKNLMDTFEGILSDLEDE
jgi:ankyrin repeat protein